MQQKLRIGLVIDESDIPAWQHALLREIVNSDYAFVGVRIQLLAEFEQAVDQGLAHSSYMAFQRHKGEKTIAHDACELVNVSELLRGVDCIEVSVEPGGDSSLQNAQTLEKLESYQLDVIVALADISSIDSLIGASKYGVWFFDYNYGQLGRADPSWVGFREVIERRPYLRSALIVRSAALHGDRTAYESFSGVIPLSHAMTRNQHLWKICAFVPRTLRDIHDRGGDQFLKRLGNEAPILKSDASRIMVNWNSMGTLVSLAKYAFQRFTLKIERRYFSEKWILMYLLKGDQRDLGTYTQLHPPKEWFWADPFVVQKDDHYFIFFEEASVTTGHGHIAAIRMDDSGNCSRSKRVLERPYHLSYPFVFEWQQETYLIAESAENRTIEVYRCKEFPYEWEFECTLMENVSAYDATLFEYNNNWWLFANIREHEGASSWDELCLFYSDNPLSGDWHPHPKNPIISDVRSARPAGGIFRKEGHIYRPSQNSSFRYGYGLNFNEVLELTKTTYKERLVECVEPNWDRSIRALHTFSAAGDLIFIDAIHRARKSGMKDVQA